MVYITYAILSINAHFDKENPDKSIYWVKFRQIVTPIIVHFIANFLMHCHPNASWHERVNAVLHFTSGPGSLRAQRPLQISTAIDVLFSYCCERPSHWTIVYKVLHVPLSGEYLAYWHWFKEVILCLILFFNSLSLVLKRFRLLYTETKMSLFWWNLHHWLQRKLSKWQLSVQPVMKISSKWWHFRFSVKLWHVWAWQRQSF